MLSALGEGLVGHHPRIRMQRASFDLRDAWSTICAAWPQPCGADRGEVRQWAAHSAEPMLRRPTEQGHASSAIVAGSD